IFWIEISGAPIILRKNRVPGHLPAEAAFIEGDTDDHTDIHFLAKREKFVLGRLVEDAVNHLHCIDQPGANGLDSVLRFPAIQAEAEVANGSVSFELLDRLAEIGIVCPCISPHMKLKQIN